MKNDKDTKYKPLTLPEVFYLATEGGQMLQVIKIKQVILKLEKVFDNHFVNLNKGSIDCFGQESI